MILTDTPTLSHAPASQNPITILVRETILVRGMMQGGLGVFIVSVPAGALN